MNSLALSFNNVEFNPIEKDGSIWLTASELANALGYARSDAISKIYERKSDEFNDEMTLTVKMGVKGFGSGNSEKETRIFSSRGCHLIAMFARTNVAKQFRKWVLDVLDKVSGKPVAVAKTHKEERAPLTSAVNLLVAKTKHLNYSDAYKLVHQRFNVEHIDEIPYDALPTAVEYVHQLIALYSNANRQGNLFEKDETYELVRGLAEAVIMGNDEIIPILLAVRMIDESTFHRCASKIVKINEHVREIHKVLDFRNRFNEPLIDENCRRASFALGQSIKIKPNWFNCPA